MHNLTDSVKILYIHAIKNKNLIGLLQYLQKENWEMWNQY